MRYFTCFMRFKKAGEHEPAAQRSSMLHHTPFPGLCQALLHVPAARGEPTHYLPRLRPWRGGAPYV